MLVDEAKAYRIGHPFIQFVANNKNKKVNRLGFTDDEFSTKKEEGEFRVATLGGSTTTGYSAWPNKLEDLLKHHIQSKPSDIPRKASVYNFGVGGYTTAHSLVNMALNVIDYKPDLVIIHHNYNDAIPARVKGFRNDYSHYYKSWRIEFHEPWDNPLHIFLTRFSDLYVSLQFLLGNGPKMSNPYSGMYISTAEKYSKNEIMDEKFHETTNAKYVFMRNLSLINVIAESIGTKVMILAGPYSRKHNARPMNWDLMSHEFSVFNDYLREFVASHPDVILVDLDIQSSDFETYYTDGYHLNNSGHELKAKLIFDSIIENYSLPQ